MPREGTDLQQSGQGADPAPGAVDAAASMGMLGRIAIIPIVVELLLKYTASNRLLTWSIHMSGSIVAPSSNDDFAAR